MAEGIISAVEVNALKTEVMQLAREPAINFFALALALTELHGSDPSALRDLPDRSKLSRRRMYYLLQTGELIRDRGIKKDVAEYVGWTKLQIIARHLTGDQRSLPPKEFKQLLGLATEHKARDLAAALRGKKVVQKRMAHFYLSTRERTLLKKALIMYGAKDRGGRLTGKERALVEILREVTDSEAKIQA